MQKMGDMWNLKHDISSPKLYELLIKIEIRGDTALELNKLCNYINMCLNELNIIR